MKWFLINIYTGFVIGLFLVCERFLRVVIDKQMFTLYGRQGISRF
ncbi:hypothetical protein [Brenneria roseae]|nr:hypothetical protein [Brenneria roseae]